MIKIEVSDKADSEWNIRLEKKGFGTFAQFDSVSQTIKSNNQKPVFLKFFDNNKNIIGQLAMAEFSRFQSQPHKVKPNMRRTLANKILNNMPHIL